MAYDSQNDVSVSGKAREESIAQEVVKEYEDLSKDRGTLEAHWEEIAARMLPGYKDRMSAYPESAQRPQGEKKNQQILDSTAVIALQRFGAILDSLLTPRNSTWHKIGPDLPELRKDRQTMMWFEQANAALFKFRYSPLANFVSQNQQNYKSLGAFGTGVVFIDKLYTAEGDKGVRYRNVHLGEIFFRENHQGIVDTAVRHFPLDARQAVQKFGDRLPEKIRTAAKNNPGQLFWFLHCVKPREDRDPNRVDFRGMAFASYYVEKEQKVFLKEEGYTSFPYAISRFEQAPGEVYGRSPAMDVLPAVKTLNEQKKVILKQGHRTVDPIILAHDDGVVDSMSLRPGSVVAGGVSPDGRPLVHTLPIGNVAIGKELMDDERRVINDSFLVNLFQVLTESPAMTATEVMERTREKSILLAPTIGRQQSEYLGPMIERELDILMELRLLPPMPEALVQARGSYRIDYESPLSRAQRAEEVAGLMRALETDIQVFNATQDHSIFDYYDWDVIKPDTLEIQGVPLRWVRSMEKVQAIRDQRSQAQDTQTMIQGAPAAAAMVKATAAADKGAPGL